MGILYRRLSPARLIRIISTSVLLFVSAGPPLCLGQNLAGTITVRVFEQESEEPVFQAEVQVRVFSRMTFSQRDFTDGSGRVTFSGVMRGSYEIVAKKAGYHTGRENVDVAPGSINNVLVRMQPLPEREPQPAASGSGTVSASSASIPARARKEYDQGLAAIKTDLAGSIAHFLRATAEYPNYAEAHAMLGLAYMRDKKSHESLKALNRAIDIDPRLADARILRGKLYLEQREFPLAEADLVEGIKLTPQAWDAHFELARCYFNQGKLDKAAEHAQRAHDLPQAATATHLLLYDIHMRRNDPASALRELEEFAKTDPQSPFMPRVRERINQLRRP